MATRYKQTKSKTYISHGLKDIRVLILDQTITFFSTKQYQLPSKSKPQLSFQTMQGCHDIFHVLFSSYDTILKV